MPAEYGVLRPHAQCDAIGRRPAGVDLQPDRNAGGLEPWIAQGGDDIRTLRGRQLGRADRHVGVDQHAGAIGGDRGADVVIGRARRPAVVSTTAGGGCFSVAIGV
jgi:hypothetical protein